MTLSGKENRAVQEVSDAINLAIERSPLVEEALENLRRLGFEANLNVKLEIALREISSAARESSEEIELELTEEDLKILRRMKISVED